MKRFIAMFLCFCLCVTLGIYAYGASDDFEFLDHMQIVDGEAHDALIMDNAHLFDDMDAICDAAEPIVEYAELFVITIEDDYNFSSKDYCRQMFSIYCDAKDDAIIFLINMDNRELWIESQGDIQTTIDKEVAETITDNIYNYARKEQYDICTLEALKQLNSVLSGEGLVSPMRFIGHLFLAATIGACAAWLWASAASSIRKPKTLDIEPKITLSSRNTIESERVRRRRSSNISGGGGGGGGGGGRSSSGGGHKF